MKLINKLILLTGIICCFALYAQSQTTAKPAETKKTAAKLPALPKSPSSIIDTFFKKYKLEGTGPAIDYLFATNKFFTNAAGIVTLKTKLDSLRLSLGLYMGKELITQRSATPSLIFYSILAKHEIQPIRFTFIFYKPQNDWVLYRFKFDDQMDIELEEAGKITNKHF